MNLIIGGDVVPTSINIESFNESKIQELLGDDLIQLWNSVDYRIFNLEVPLYDGNNPIYKSGPNLKAPTSTIKGLSALKPSLISMSNNHIMDHGIQGMNSTTDLLKQYKIPYIGVGDNIDSVVKTHIIHHGGKKIGVFSCAQTEYSIATEESPGANPFDPFESLEEIRNLKSQCNYVIILYHGGVEQYRYPTPYDQRIARKMAEYGGDIIVFQHSHSVGCFENYGNSLIVYGQGNFIFSKHNNEYWNTGILLKLTIDDELSVQYIPIVKVDRGVKMALNHEASDILNGFYARSEEINEKEFIEKQYNLLVNSRLNYYLYNLSGMNKWIFRMDRYLFNGKILNKKFNRSRMLGILNYFACESHRDLIIRGLTNKIYNERE